MSVRVNLLPQATRDRVRAVRQRLALGSSFVLLLLTLGLVYWWATAQVSSAREVLAHEQMRTDELQSEVDALVEFRRLSTRRDEANRALQEAFAGEVSLAGVLQDLAAVIPSDAQLDTLAITLRPGTPPTDGEVGATLGTFNATGHTLTSHAPGVERLLLSIDKIRTFTDVYLSSSSLTDPDERIAVFTFDGQLDGSAATHRYGAGLPEELR